MSNECMNYHKHLADKIAQKYFQRYEDVRAYIRCKLSFMILKSALLCQRGSSKANTECDVEDEILNNAASATLTLVFNIVFILIYFFTFLL